MEITITEKTDQPLLSRQQVLGKVSFSGVTPSKDSFRKELAKKLGISEELLLIKKIEMLYGNQAAYFQAMAYKKKQDMELIETKQSIKKNFKAKPEASKPAQEAPEEKKAPDAEVPEEKQGAEPAGG